VSVLWGVRGGTPMTERTRELVDPGRALHHDLYGDRPTGPAGAAVDRARSAPTVGRVAADCKKGAQTLVVVLEPGAAGRVGTAELVVGRFCVVGVRLDQAGHHSGAAAMATANFAITAIAAATHAAAASVSGGLELAPTQDPRHWDQSRRANG